MGLCLNVLVFGRLNVMMLRYSSGLTWGTNGAEGPRMSDKEPVHLTYFSDLLCIWAYVAEARVNEVRQKFSERIVIAERTCSVFHDTAHHIGQGWKARGSWSGFNTHLAEVAAKFDHIVLHPELWVNVRPASSASPHLFIKAAQRVERRLSLPLLENGGHTRLPSECLAWELRLAFFRDGRDIASHKVQREVAASLDLPCDEIEVEIENGSAFGSLGEDIEACKRLDIKGSPTFVLNEGRQKLYGNVGYRVIEANIQELLREPNAGEPSWC